MPRPLTASAPRISAARRVFGAAYRIYVSRDKASELLDALSDRLASGAATETDHTVAAELRRLGVDLLSKDKAC